MSDTKLCPMRKKIIQDNEGYWNGEEFMECVKEKCAWYHEVEDYKTLGQCVLANLIDLGWWAAIRT